MSKPPKVSVILPFFNAQHTLAAAIQSILVQTFTDFELILVDNNSTDKSYDVAQEFRANDPRVLLLSEEKRGVVPASNRALAESRGLYVSRMDADDIAYSSRLSVQVALLDRKPNIGMVSGLVEYVGDRSNGGFVKYVKWLNTIKDKDQIRLNQFTEYPIANPTVTFRRKLYQTYGGYEDGLFPEDYEFFLRLQSHGVEMEKVNDVVLKWSDLPDRLTRTDNRYSHEAFFQIKAQYLAAWLEANNPYHPSVWVWGSGRVSRRRSDFLKKHGVEIASYIDLRESKGSSVVHFERIPSACFILSYVSTWGARDQIKNYLDNRGFKEGKNYLICA